MSLSRSVALVSAGVFATAASAIVNMVQTFAPIGPGITENPNVDGMAVVNFNEEDFESHVTLVAFGLVKNASYGVRVDSNGAGQAQAQAFTARTFLGIGVYNTTIPGDATFGTVIDIFKWDGDPDPFQVFEVTPAEERARGFGSNIL